MHTLAIVLFLILLLALIVDGVLLTRYLRRRGGGGSRPLLVVLLVAVMAVGLVAGLAAIREASTVRVSLRQAVIDDLQRYYYKPVDPAKLAQAADRGGIDGMLKSLNDPYTVYMDAKQTALLAKDLEGPTYGGIGAILEKKDGRVVIIRVVEGSPAAAAGLMPGDVIAAVDGKATAGEPLAVVSSRVRGKAGTSVRLQVRRQGTATPLSLTLTRRLVKRPLTYSQLFADRGIKVGYVYLSTFSDGAAKEVRAALRGLQRRGAQRIILDLRSNGGGWLGEGVGVASAFLRPGLVVVTTQGMHSPEEVLRSVGTPATTLPVVVLVNHWSASSSEIVSGALQDWGRATIIGTRTFGKGLVQTPFLSLPGGATLKLTVAVYLTPKGTDINHVGIAPSIVAKDDPKTKRDEALDRALRFIATGH